ncbi:MAG: hypothetical protein NTZ36_02230, partial [Candidatus Jorgensenbacteria bacterium]|nr:hypothetical protein [Candidatus Jorgensenbacteria bacterium]
LPSKNTISKSEGVIPTIFHSVNRFSASIFDSIGSFFRMVFTPARNAEGATTVYDNYFTTLVTTSNPVIIDKNLTKDTVYMYRVRAITNGTQGVWSTGTATKTLSGSTQSGTATAPVCTRNSFCAGSINKFSATGESSEIQCANNNDCKKVGNTKSSTGEQ